MIDFKVSLDDHQPLIEFSYKNSYYSSIGMAPFEALSCRRGTSLVWWFHDIYSSILGQKIIHDALQKVRLVRDRLSTAYNRQKSYENCRKWPLEFNVGGLVNLKI